MLVNGQPLFIWLYQEFQFSHLLRCINPTDESTEREREEGNEKNCFFYKFIWFIVNDGRDLDTVQVVICSFAHTLIRSKQIGIEIWFISWPLSWGSIRNTVYDLIWSDIDFMTRSIRLVTKGVIYGAFNLCVPWLIHTFANRKFSRWHTTFCMETCELPIWYFQWLCVFIGIKWNLKKR